MRWVWITLGTVFGLGFIALGALLVSMAYLAVTQIAGTNSENKADAATLKVVAAANDSGRLRQKQLVVKMYPLAAKAGLIPVGTGGPQHICSEGNNNFTWHDGFKLQCKATEVVVLGGTITSEADLRDRLVTLDAQINSAGWIADPHHSLKDSATAAPLRGDPPGLIDRKISAGYDHPHDGTIPHTGGATEAGMSITIANESTRQDAKFDIQGIGGSESAALAPTIAYLNGHPKRYVVILRFDTTTYQE